MKIGLLDAQWFLRRNFMLLKNHGLINYCDLYKSLIQSVCKVTRENGLNKVYCLWDSAPYKRVEFIKEYKSDRVYLTEDNLKQITPDMTQEEIDQINKYNEELKKNLELEKVFRQVKYDFINTMTNYGMISIISKGYEADDLAYYICNKFNIEDELLLFTKDSDWISLLSKNAKLIRMTKSPEVYDYEKAYGILGNNFRSVPLVELGIIKDLILGSHNGTCGINLGLSYQDVLESYSKNELSSKVDPEAYKNFEFRMINSNPNKYFDDNIKNAIEVRLNYKGCRKLTYPEWFTNFNQKGIGVYFNYLKSFVNRVVNNEITDTNSIDINDLKLPEVENQN